MKKIVLLLCFVILTIDFSGCTSRNFVYKPPETIIPIENKSTISYTTKDKIWSKLIQGIGANFFVINNMDKQSGFINISYMGDPEKYVYGGELHYHFSNLRGDWDYIFPAARTMAQYSTMINGVLCTLTRKLTLDGRINILVNEIDSTDISITVNTRYILTLNISGNDVLGHYLAPYQETFSFDTGRSVTSAGGTTYYSNGELEQTIIDLVK